MTGYRRALFLGQRGFTVNLAEPKEVTVPPGDTGSRRPCTTLWNSGRDPRFVFFLPRRRLPTQGISTKLAPTRILAERLNPEENARMKADSVQLGQNGTTRAVPSRLPRSSCERLGQRERPNRPPPANHSNCSPAFTPTHYLLSARRTHPACRLFSQHINGRSPT